MLKSSRRRTAMQVLLVALCAGVLSVALYASHSWGNYHWARTSNPFTLKVGDNMSSTWDSHLDVAISDWSKSSVLDLTKVTGGTRPKNCRPTAGRIESCNERYGNTGWLGIAQIWLSGGHISQAVAKMNDTYFDTPTYNTPAWRQLVVCQEIAHGFGLGHQDEDFDNANLGSCMDYTSDPASNQHPNQHDYAQLESIYSHTDSTTTISQKTNMPGAMNDIDTGSRANWGRLISESANHGHSVYELDFGHGNKVITFVTWTLEERGRRAEAAKGLSH